MTKILKNMVSKKVLPVVIPVIAVLVLLVAKSWGSGKTEPGTRYEKVLTYVAELLEREHFSPKKFDDKFSKEVFAQFIKALDPDKSIFLQSDIDQLKKQELQIDNELRTGKMELVPEADAIYKKRMAEVSLIYKQLLAKPFDFSVKESLQVDRDKMSAPKTAAERQEVWRKRLKYMVLERYSDALDNREKTKKDSGFVYKADTTLERESRDRVRKIWDKSIERLKNKFSLDEKFNLYVNTIAEHMDPHTEFFPPVEKRAFDEQMSGRFYGIGAQLQEQEGYIKITNLITGMPAWKSGEIKVNDIILKVAQGAEEPVDIAGYETEDAVKLIRGKKGTEVRLTLRKVDGSVKVVKLIRDEIVQDEAFARSAVVEKDGNKLGYIYLPDFYADFENPAGHFSARDVAAEVKKLMADNVSGIVLDLRYNGGGSLQEVVKMVGLFIDEGPVVQVKDRDGAASVYRDQSRGALYSGPLVVMINEFSASASEIFAAAIQDYGRGVIVGSSSFGKGTVQRQVNLDPSADYFSMGSASDLGSLKLTLQKFYRINGGSTQLRGVTPDVLLPDNFEFTKYREKDNPDALPWDEIAKADYKPWAGAATLQGVEKLIQQKIDTNTRFRTIRTNSKWLSDAADQEISLNLASYKERQLKIKAAVKQNESLQALSVPMSVTFMKADEERIAAMDKDKGDRFKAWLKNLKTDIYLAQSFDIISDVIGLEKTAKK